MSRTPSAASRFGIGVPLACRIDCSLPSDDLLADQEVEVAYVTGSVAQQAYENASVFVDRPEVRYEGLRAIATVYPNPQWFVVIVDSIQSIHDLKGKRAFVEMQGSNGEAW